MNAPSRAASGVDADIQRYRRVRAVMPTLAAGLSAEDLQAQSMPDASPGKWHLAHTSWFFEAMLLGGRDGEASDVAAGRLFNSYYEALGERVARQDRGLMTRPSLEEVLAAENGQVIYAGSGVEGYGNLILIRHPNGYVSAYAHLKDMNVAKGTVVNRGDNIGTAGKTGGVAKSQLHFELRKGATPVDPIPLLAS